MPSLHTSAQTAPTKAIFHGVWTCPDSADFQITGQLPGSLHQTLIRSGQIQDPFVGTNEEKIQWVGEKSWVFTSEPFNKNVEMVFLNAESVQMYSKWILNGVRIGSTSNAFIPNSFYIEELLKPTNNILIVEFNPPFEEESHRLEKAGHPLPGDASRAVHRMPQFAFGWDWGPKLLDISVNGLTFKSSHISIKDINLETISLGEKSAECKVGWTLEGDEGTNASMRWALTNHNGAKVAWGSASGKIGDYSETFTLDFPELWWTHDLGDPYLYRLEVIAFNSSGLLGQTVKRVGVRTLELNTENDAFKFILNGQPIYSMGSNVVPCDIILNRITNKEEKSIIDAAISANMNTLRIWGGGLYASDYFMDYCDEKGVLIWHDFMFACAMYPSDEDFLKSVKNEAEYQCKRLRHHPSLAIWCGNNEVSEGWERWGWKDGLSKSEIEVISSSYNKVFNELLPSVVSEFDDAPYWESSPMLGRGDNNFKNIGDAHDWGIWHDGYSFDSLWTRVPRFMSEYGFQSFPLNSTFKSILSHDSILYSQDFRTHPEIVAHEKHPRGFDIIDAYLEKSHGALICDSIEFGDWAYLSRVIQAEGIAEGAIAGRINQHHCSGTLVWQLNDCWPVASWSSIDDHGKWKLLHHKLKDAFQPVLLHGDYVDQTLNVGITANPGVFTSTVPGTLIVYLKTLENEILHSEVVNLSVTSGKTTWISFDDLVPADIDLNNIVAHLLWSGDDASVVHKASDKVYFVEPGSLNLKKGSIFIKRFGWSEDRYLFEISANTYVKDVELYSPQEGNFSENGFDLFPGASIRVSFDTYDMSTKKMEEKGDPQIFARSLNDFVTK